ncbi:MAG: ABC transporter permease, partial [Rudaea sp.]
MKNFLINFATLIVIAICVFVLAKLPLVALLALLVVLALWMAFTRAGQQAWSVTEVGIATIPQRLGSSSVIVVGIAGVVGVLVALLAMGQGFKQTLSQTGDEMTAIVLRGGATAELSSGVGRDQATLIAQMPGIAKDAKGKPIVSAELVVVANVPKKSSGTDANVEIRGVGEEAFALRPNVKIVDGRKFKAGLRELIVGKGALMQFAGLQPGSKLNLNNQQWDIVGTFE